MNSFVYSFPRNKQTFEAALRLPAVDGDPHFMIELPDKDDALCFNINNKPGTIFSLVRDPESGQNSDIHSTSLLTVHLSTFAGGELNINLDTLCGFTQTHFEKAKFVGGGGRSRRLLFPSGIVVNGQVIGDKKIPPDGVINTYFSRFGILHQALGVRLEVSTQDISVFQSGKWIKILWSEAASLKGTK